jgi:hypothetical protein
MNFKLITKSFAFLMLLIISIMPFTGAVIDVNTYAVSRDFTIVSPYNDVSICSCSTKYDSITVTNIGTWPAMFTVSTNKIDSTLTLSENSFELAPGASKEIFLYITADCSRGSDDLKITVTSNLGVEKTLEKRVVRDRCQNVEMWATNSTREIGPCQSKNIELNIHNVGPFAETYTLDSNYDKYITYNADSFTLEPNQYSKITATIKFDCGMYGQKDILFKTHSQNNKLTATVNVPLDIRREFDYDFNINNVVDDSVNVQVCNRMQSTKVPIVIKNNGAVPNTYTVELNGLPKSAIVEELIDGKFSLNPGETKTFYINVDSTSYRKEHKFEDFTVKINPEIGDFVKEKKIVLEFTACYEYDVIVYDYGNSKNRPLRTCANFDYSYDINIVNNGLFKETFFVSLVDSPHTVKLSKYYTELSPGDNDMLKLLITGPDDNDVHKILLKVVSDNAGIEEYREVWIKGYDVQSCHNTAIGKDKAYEVNYQTNTITVPIKNTGIVDNSYLALLNSNSSLLNFKNNVGLITVGQSKTEKLTLNVNSTGKEEGIYTDVLTLMDSSGAKYSKDLVVKLKDKSFLRKTFEYLAFDGICKQVSMYQILAILIFIVLIIVFLIIGPHYPYNFWNRLKSKIPVVIFLFVIFLIGLILVISFTGLPKTHEEVYNLTVNDSGLTYEWLEDDKFVLNVDQFFYDPENRTLDYNVEGLENIKAISKDKVISFYPRYGWSGTEHAKIIAIDDMGGNVTSPEFTFIVRDVNKKSFAEIFNVYCWYFNLLIFLILLIFIFILVFVKQKRRTRK